ncbi:MAG: 2-oxoacid:acceptor oxidoreductase family protein, partial [Clostridia bacterium]
SEGDADYIIAFERLEALRWCHYLKKDGTIFINDQRIMPMPVITGMADYPENIYESLTAGGYNHAVIDGLELAAKAGSTKAVNVVMLGALMHKMGVSVDDASKAVSSAVPPKALEINMKALAAGYGL